MKNMPSTKEYKNLISLLDDPDHDVAAAVHARIMEQGAAMLPYLEAALKRRCNKQTKQRIANIMALLHRTQAEGELNAWLAQDGKDIVRGMYCVAKFFFPYLNYDDVRCMFDEIVSAIEARIVGGESALDKVKIINEILFKTYKFRNNYLLNYDTSGHFVHQMLDKCYVNTLSLILLYLALAERLGITMKLVSLPENFIIWCNNSFYINPALDGEIFGIHKLKPYPEIPMKSEDDMPLCAAGILMVYHLARALLEAYESDNKPELAKQAAPIIKILAAKVDAEE
jgi:regulator of sirC expression with transglutaminase-like and TPR domain